MQLWAVDHCGNLYLARQCCLVAHPCCRAWNMKLGDRDYFIWQKSLLFFSDMINKRVKHIPSEVSTCHISFSIWSMLLVDREG